MLNTDPRGAQREDERWDHIRREQEVSQWFAGFVSGLRELVDDQQPQSPGRTWLDRFGAGRSHSRPAGWSPQAGHRN